MKSDALSLLLHHGAKVHRVSTSGFSPFHIGLIQGSDVLVGQLLRSVHSSGVQAEVLPSLPEGETAAEYALKHSPRPLFETLCSISPQSFQSVDFVKAVADILTMPRVDETKPREYAAELGIDSVHKTPSSHIPTCGFSAHHPASCDKFVEDCNKVVCWTAEASSAEQRELFITPDRIFGAYYRWLPGKNILEFYKLQAANPDDPLPKWECEQSLRNMLYALKPTEVAATPPVSCSDQRKETQGPWDTEWNSTPFAVPRILLGGLPTTISTYQGHCARPFEPEVELPRNKRQPLPNNKLSIQLIQCTSPYASHALFGRV